METLEQQIQPFLLPLINRIEALEADNLILKQTIEQLNNSNKQPTKVGGVGVVKPVVKPGVIKPVTPVAPVEPKPVGGIKKDPKVVVGNDKGLGGKVQRPATTADKQRPSVKPGDKEPKQPTTDRKEPSTKDPKNVVSPKPAGKGKEVPKPPTPAPVNKKQEPTKDPKDNKVTSPKPADKTKVLTGGKQTEAPKPKPDAKVEEVKQGLKQEVVATDVSNVLKKQQTPPLVPEVQEAPAVVEAPQVVEVKQEPKQEVTQTGEQVKEQKKEDEKVEEKEQEKKSEEVIESKGDQALAKESADQNQTHTQEAPSQQTQEQKKEQQPPAQQDLI